MGPVFPRGRAFRCCSSRLPAFVAGCGGVNESGLDAGPLTVPDAGVADTGAPIPTAALFDPGHIVQVRMNLAPADWDQLRQQTRNLFDILTGDCVGAPFPSPFTYFSGTVWSTDRRRCRAWA